MSNILECKCMAIELSLVRSETSPRGYKDEYYIWGKSGISPTSGEQMWKILGIRER